MSNVNLKPYYDAALAADAEKQTIMAEMDAAFNEGTEEGKTKALELRPALDAAKVKAEEANKLYASMRDASANSTSAPSKFVSDQTDAEESGKNVKTFAEYQALTPKERLAFSKAGGRIQN